VRTELHCHSTASDGRLSPTELLKLAGQRDIGVLALTDHDTIAGHEEAARVASSLGIRFIPGIEISALSDEGKEVHVLGYGVRPSDDATRSTLLSLRDVRMSRAKAMLAKLDTLGIHIAFERVQAMAGDGMIGRPHVARALLEAGAVQSIQDAFDCYLAEGEAAFVPHDGLNPGQAVALIHAAHGAAVMAHPMLYRGNLDSLMANLIAAGVDGLEAVYPMHTPQQTQDLQHIATNHELLVTGGSDFHGVVGDAEVTLGSIQLPDDAIRILDERIARYAA